MKYLVDTCVISELIKKSPNKNVIEWISNSEEEDLYLSTLTIGELKKGITKLDESKKKRELSSWFKELELRFKNRIIPIDIEVAQKWGHVQGDLEIKGKGMPTIDGLIACSALAKGLTVVTRNWKDMKKSGVEIIDPWE